MPETSRIKELPLAERPREKLAILGSPALSDAELLALFFRTGRRGVSAIDLGRELLKEFGSLQAIARCSVAELARFPGIGPAKASQLAAVFEVGNRLAREKFSDRAIDSPEVVHELLGSEMRALRQESLRSILLDTRGKLLRVVEVTRGTVNESLAHPREIFLPAITLSATSFILVHNHPSGDPSPSSADIRLTRKLRDASQTMEIEMADHVIIGAPSPGNDAPPYFSFREAGLI